MFGEDQADEKRYEAVQQMKRNLHTWAKKNEPIYSIVCARKCRTRWRRMRRIRRIALLDSNEEGLELLK